MPSRNPYITFDLYSSKSSSRVNTVALGASLATVWVGETSLMDKMRSTKPDVSDLAEVVVVDSEKVHDVVPADVEVHRCEEEVEEVGDARREAHSVKILKPATMKRNQSPVIH